MNIYDIYIDGVGVVASSVLGLDAALRERHDQLVAYRRRNACLNVFVGDALPDGYILDTVAVSQCSACSRYCCARIRKVGVAPARARRSCRV